MERWKKRRGLLPAAVALKAASSTFASTDCAFPTEASTNFDVVEHGASVAIIAIPQPDHIVLVRQFRHAAGRALWEIPAGTADSGEAPAAAAGRELREETGYAAGRIQLLGSVWTTPGFCSEQMHFFLAEELTAGTPAFDEDERIEIGTFCAKAAWRLVAEGTTDAKTLLALLWLQQGAAREFGSDLKLRAGNVATDAV